MRTYLGDCLEVMKELETNSIDAIVTDPPYGLSFMGKRWDYDVPSKAIWIEALRVLKPGGHLLSFGGTRTYHRMVVNIEDAGFEVRDQIQWLYGSGFPKSHNLPGGTGTALKPANEPIVLARKPLIGTVAKNVEKFGTGGLNIDESRIAGETPSIDRRKNAAPGESVGATGWTTPARPASYNEQRAGEMLGRWPANVILDEEAAMLLDEQVGRLAGGGPSSGRGFQDQYVGGKVQVELPIQKIDRGGFPSRFFYVAKTSKRERNAGLEGMPERKFEANIGSTKNQLKRMQDGKVTGDRNNAPKANHHPTVKPIRLMQYLIKLVTPKGGIVLDPFMGSGSTGCAATSLGYDFIGIEMNEEYKEIADRRIDFHSVWPESPDAEVKEDEQIELPIDEAVGD